MIGPGAWGATRALLRLARRDAWRNKGRSALIALMVALPVLAISVVSVFYRSGQLEPRDVVALQLGDRVQAVVRVGQLGTPLIQNFQGNSFMGADPGLDWRVAGDTPLPSPAEIRRRVQALVPAGDQVLPDVNAYAGRSLRFGDRALSATIREFDYTAPGVGTMVEQLSGRAPAAKGEVVVTRALSRRAGIQVGDTLTYRATGAPSPQLSVVGIVGGITLAQSDQLIGRPRELLPPGTEDRSASSWVVTGSEPVDADRMRRANQIGLLVLSRDVALDPSPQAQAARDTLSDQARSRLTQGDLDLIGVITVTIGLLLLQIALLAGPAIAVGARRNERTLALTAANGAVPRQLRSVVLATSGVIGLAGCTVAAVLGAGLGVIGVIIARDRYDQLLPRADVHITDLLVLAGVGALTAVAAALIPARLASRLNVIATLTGRRGQPRPARRVPVLGVLLLLIGCAVCFFGATRKHLFLTVLGIAIAEIGLVSMTGAIISLLARTGRFLPFSARFAVRDAARQRGRTAPAVAAVMAAIAGSVAAGVFLASQDAQDRGQYRPLAAIGVTTVWYSAVDDNAQALPPQELAETRAAVEAALRRTLPVSRIVPTLQPAPSEVPPTIELEAAPGWSCPDPAYMPPGMSCDPTGPRLLAPSVGGTSLFDTGDALDAITGQAQPQARAALAAGRVAVFAPEMLWPDQTVHVQVLSYDNATGEEKSRAVTLPAQLVRAQGDVRVPGSAFPPSAAAKLGLTLTVKGAIVTSTRTPTAQEEERAVSALQDVADGVLVVERGYQSDTGVVLLVLVGACALVTLAGTFTAVGLAAAEGKADVSILAAVGAGPGVRRRIAAAQAGVITVLGGALGLGTGLLAGWALVRLMGADASVYSDGWFGWGSGVAGWPFTVPWPAVLASVLGTPLLAIVIAFLVTRSRLPLVRRLGQ